MKKILFIVIVFLIKFQLSYAQQVIVSPDTFTIKQSNNTTISIVGKGNMHLHWTETIDGYTIMRNKKGIYEYALLSKDCLTLIPSGRKAHNPQERRYFEKRFLRRKIKKHIRPAQGKYFTPKTNRK